MGSCSNKSDKRQSTKSKASKTKLKFRTSNQNISMNNDKPYEAKVVLLGDKFVGKSSIVNRFCKGIYTEQYVVTIGGAYFQPKITLPNGKVIKLHIWDTGGEERFRSMASLYYRDAVAAILTYDCTCIKSFESISFWIDELNKKSNQENMLLCLAGNKCDKENKEKEVLWTDAKRLADKNKMIFYETSAKSNIGIKEMFNALGKRLYDSKLVTN